MAAVVILVRALSTSVNMAPRWAAEVLEVMDMVRTEAWVDDVPAVVRMPALA